MSGTKQLFMPTHYNPRTHREEPQTLAGYTGDGHVGLTAQAFDLGVEMSHENATRLASELLSASYHAHRLHDEARGFNEWVARPVGGGMFDVDHAGETCRFRPIINGKRRQRADVSSERAHRCTACRRESPPGATMYVPVKKDENGFFREGIGFGWNGHRICDACVRPELAAAVIGVALVSDTGPTEGS